MLSVLPTVHVALEMLSVLPTVHVLHTLENAL